MGDFVKQWKGKRIPTEQQFRRERGDVVEQVRNSRTAEYNSDRKETGDFADGVSTVSLAIPKSQAKSAKCYQWRKGELSISYGYIGGGD